jgi:hypothetical protein
MHFGHGQGSFFPICDKNVSTIQNPRSTQFDEQKGYIKPNILNWFLFHI